MTKKRASNESWRWQRNGRQRGKRRSGRYCLVSQSGGHDQPRNLREATRQAAEWVEAKGAWVEEQAWEQALICEQAWWRDQTRPQREWEVAESSATGEGGGSAIGEGGGRVRTDPMNSCVLIRSQTLDLVCTAGGHCPQRWPSRSLPKPLVFVDRRPIQLL